MSNVDPVTVLGTPVGGCEMSSCIRVAPAETAAGRGVLITSRYNSAGVFADEVEWVEFLRKAKAGEFDDMPSLAAANVA